jgi:hypothetical protein
MGVSSNSRIDARLGRHQIAWLRANVPAFEDAWKAVKASDAHAARIRARLEAKGRVQEEGGHFSRARA